MASSDEMDSISIAVLDFASRNVLSQFMNPQLNGVIKSGPWKGLTADWKGFAEMIGADFSTIKNLGSDDSMKNLLEKWLNMPSWKDATIGNLKLILEQLGRKDCLNELSWYLERDIRKHLKRKSEKENSQTSRLCDWTDHHVNEFNMMCIGDEQGKPTMFDAFVCHAEEDILFVKEMIKHLEGPQHNLKLCVPERDMIAGSSTYTIVSKIMAERCRRIIIVVSPEFYDSPMCDYQIKFAFTLNPGSRIMKLLPVIVKEGADTLPPVLRPFTKLNYTRPELMDWFWQRLGKVIKDPLPTESRNRDLLHQKALHSKLLKGIGVFESDLPACTDTSDPKRTTCNETTKKKKKVSKSLLWFKKRIFPALTLRYKKETDEIQVELSEIEESDM